MIEQRRAVMHELLDDPEIAGQIDSMRQGQVVIDVGTGQVSVQVRPYQPKRVRSVKDPMHVRLNPVDRPREAVV